MALAPGHGLLIIERILRDRDSVWQQVVEERGLKELSTQMLASSAISLACYGAVLGASSGAAQAVSSAIKLPLLFLATLAICLPTLYLFNLLFGARLSVMQAVALIMVSITVTSVLTLAFAPISLFFLISAESYSFFKLLNVGILVLAAAVGLKFLTQGMAVLNDHQERVVATATVATTHLDAIEAAPVARDPDGELALVGAVTTETSGNGSPASGASAVTTGTATGSRVVAALGPPTASEATWPAAGSAAGSAHRPGQRPASMTLLYIWIALFGFVGTQLGWTLRPFFGSPGRPFAIFRPIEGTFYGDIFETIGRLLGG